METLRQCFMAIVISMLGLGVAVAAPMTGKVTQLTLSQQQVLFTLDSANNSVCAQPGWSFRLNTPEGRALYDLLLGATFAHLPVMVEGSHLCDAVGHEIVAQIVLPQTEGDETRTFNDITASVKDCAFKKIMSSKQLFDVKLPPIDVEGEATFYLVLYPFSQFQIHVSYPGPTDVMLRIDQKPGVITNAQIWGKISDELQGCRG